MNFTFTAKSNSGTLSGGVMTADTLADVRRKLREQGLFAVTITPAAGARAASTARAARGRHVPKRELLTMTSQLSVMARSGVDLASALRSISEQTAHPTLKAALERVHEAVSAGKPVSAALREQEEVFGGAYIASVAAGEASGKLPEVLSRMSEMLRKELRQQATVRTLLAYPIVLTLVSTLVIGVLVLFVLPQFAEVFDQLDAPLPAITRLLLDASNELRRHIWIWLGALVGLVVWARFYLRSRAGRRRMDALKLNIAVFR
ncbi:MAG: type II secretion system F family protein, partial [Pirellulales bacterium]